MKSENCHAWILLVDVLCDEIGNLSSPPHEAETSKAKSEQGQGRGFWSFLHIELINLRSTNEAAVHEECDLLKDHGPWRGKCNRVGKAVPK